MIVENCGVIQAFGLHATAVRSVAELLGIPTELVRDLRQGEQIVALADQTPEVMRRLDYRTHPMFRDCWIDKNPRYARLK